jgi:hypothetical protein
MPIIAFIVANIIQAGCFGFSVYSFFNEDVEAALYWVIVAVYFKLINPVPPPPLPED